MEASRVIFKAMNVIEWIKGKWKAIAIFLATLFGLITFIARTRSYKGVLKNANDAHKKETKINKEASDQLDTITQEITNNLEGDLKESQDKHIKIKATIKKERQDFEKDLSVDKNLAEEIANHLGADFVKNDK